MLIVIAGKVGGLIMMDKQIIDGVDVSGCESFCNGICCKAGFGDDASCKLFSDCNYKQFKRNEQECLELKERLSCNCFDPKSNNNRCVSYNRIAEDYERDLKRLNTLEACIIKIISMCEKASTKSTFCNGVENKDMQNLAIRILKVLNDNKV